MTKKRRKSCRVGGIEFKFIGAPKGYVPYLWLGKTQRELASEYIGAIDGLSNIRKLRDFLTEVIRNA